MKTTMTSTPLMGKTLTITHAGRSLFGEIIAETRNTLTLRTQAGTKMLVKNTVTIPGAC